MFLIASFARAGMKVGCRAWLITLWLCGGRVGVGGRVRVLVQGVLLVVCVVCLCRGLVVALLRVWDLPSLSCVWLVWPAPAILWWWLVLLSLCGRRRFGCLLSWLVGFVSP